MYSYVLCNLIVSFQFQGCLDTEKICREGLANHHLYKPVFSRTVATGFYATSSGGLRPPTSQMPFDESDEETAVDPETDLSGLPGPQSGDKRPSSSRQQPKQSRKKKGKMQQSVDETFLNMASVMTERFGLGEHHVDGPPKDPFDLSACVAVVRGMQLDIQTQFRVIEYLRLQDKETKKAFIEFDAEFRMFWVCQIAGLG